MVMTHQSASYGAESVMALICYAAVIIAAITVICMGIMAIIYSSII